MRLFRNTLQLIGIVAAAATLVTACDSQGADSSSTERTPQSNAATSWLPSWRTGSSANHPPFPPGVTMGPAPAAEPVDYTDVLRYIESEERFTRYDDAFDTVVGAIMGKMQSGEIPSMIVAASSTSMDETTGDPIEVASEKEILLTSLPVQEAYATGQGNSPASELAGYPLVVITLPLVEGKPDFSAPLAIKATLPDGSTFDLQRVGARGIPFTGRSSGLGLHTAVTSIRDSNSSPLEQTVIDGVVKTVPAVSVMGMPMSQDKLTVDAIKQADRIILKQLQDVSVLNGSNWY